MIHEEIHEEILLFLQTFHCVISIFFSNFSQSLVKAYLRRATGIKNVYERKNANNSACAALFPLVVEKKETREEDLSLPVQLFFYTYSFLYSQFLVYAVGWHKNTRVNGKLAGKKLNYMQKKPVSPNDTNAPLTPIHTLSEVEDRTEMTALCLTSP